MKKSEPKTASSLDLPLVSPSQGHPHGHPAIPQGRTLRLAAPIFSPGPRWARLVAEEAARAVPARAEDQAGDERQTDDCLVWMDLVADCWVVICTMAHQFP